MKIKFYVAAAGLAFFALNASAQSDSKTKVKTKTETAAKAETPANTEAQATAPAAPAKPAVSSTGSVAPTAIIPVAEFYEGGQTAMYDFIAQNMVYPPAAKRSRMQGQCIVSFTLNDDGTTSNLKVLKEAGGGTGAEAMRIVKLLKFKPPGYSLETTIPVTFKL